MFTITCHRCAETTLVGSRAIRSIHQTSSGPVAYVECPRGHLTVHEFRTGSTRAAGDGPSPVAHGGDAAVGTPERITADASRQRDRVA